MTVNRLPPDKEVAVFVTFTLKEYLAGLEAEEGKLPPTQRREVPNIPALAEAAQISRQALYNLVNGQVQSINFQVLSAILSELRRRGFDAEVSDLLTTYPAETSTPDPTP